MAKKKSVVELNFKEVKYTFRRNRADYESEELSLLAEIPEGADIDQSIEAVKAKVMANVSKYRVNEEEDEAPSKKSSSKKNKAAKEEEEDEDETEEEEEDEEEESEDDSDGDEDSEEEEEDEDEEEEEVKPKKGKSAKSKSATSSKGKSKQAKGAAGATSASKKKRKGKVTPYDREKDLHKDMVSILLDGAFPKWEKKEKLVKKAKNASKKMDGADFLDSEGNILDSFREEFLEFMDN